jgi:hypothetical protein
VDKWIKDRAAEFEGPDKAEKGNFEVEELAR